MDAECGGVEVPVEIVVEPFELFEVGSVLLVVLVAGGVYVVEPECDDGCEYEVGVDVGIGAGVELTVVEP